MGSLLAIVGPEPPEHRQARLEAMAARSPYRGTLRTLHLPELSIGVQARGDECTLHQQQHLTVACHGRVYDPSAAAMSIPAASSAELIAQGWLKDDIGCLTTLDGEFSVLVHDRRNASIRACISLSMSRLLYWTRHQGLTVLASEVRQAATGAGIAQRLDLEQVAQTLCINGPVLDLERTEYVGINRLIAPTVYEIDANTGPRPGRDYWRPPPTQPLTPDDSARLPTELADILAAGIDHSPPHTGFSLSGGYDSGALWILANRPAGRRDDFRAYAITAPGTGSDESAVIQRLLEQTSTSAVFLDALSAKPSEFAADHARCIDRLPGAPTLHMIDLASERMRRDGITQCVQGLGAEAYLDAPAIYAADLLRQGRWWALIQDAPRFRAYGAQARHDRIGAVSFLKAALNPPGSWVRRLRGNSVPAPEGLHPRWHDLFRTSWAALQVRDADDGYARTRVRQNFRYNAIVGGLERVEQLSERYGVETLVPYRRRTLADFGFRTPARAINGGRHPKHLLRQSARAVLGADPPWPYTKVVLDALSHRDVDLVLGLGPVADWSIVGHDLITAEYAQAMIDQCRRDGVRPMFSARFATAERHLRTYGA